MKALKTFLCGVIIGIANIIPGVSGGTMAVMLNVYDKILLAFSVKNIKCNITFLGILGAGTIFGIFSFSSGVTYLFEHYYMIVNYCFIGLVLGSAPMIYKKAKYKGVEPKNWIPFILALFIMIGIAIIKIMNVNLGGTGSAIGSAANGVEALPFHILLVWLFISAFISTIAMLLPGISGSFMMLLFGSYALVMKAIAEMDFIILACTGLGIIAGGLVGIKLIKIMLSKHPQALYFAILGLVIGSIFSIFPGFSLDMEGLISAGGFLVCVGVSFGFGRIGQ